MMLLLLLLALETINEMRLYAARTKAKKLKVLKAAGLDVSQFSSPLGKKITGFLLLLLLVTRDLLEYFTLCFTW